MQELFFYVLYYYGPQPRECHVSHNLSTYVALSVFQKCHLLGPPTPEGDILSGPQEQQPTWVHMQLEKTNWRGRMVKGHQSWLELKLYQSKY